MGLLMVTLKSPPKQKALHGYENASNIIKSYFNKWRIKGLNIQMSLRDGISRKLNKAAPYSFWGILIFIVEA